LACLQDLATSLRCKRIPDPASPAPIWQENSMTAGSMCPD
jgi:hypothetical protein